MKKFVSILAAGALLATLLAGCGSNSGSSAATGSSAPESAPASEPASEPSSESTEGTGLKFGLGLVTSLSGSDATADKDGSAKADVTAASVLVDGENKVVSCYIDVMQVAMPFTAAGAMNIADDAVFNSKQVLGTAYGMKDVSPIGKEWDEQAAAFCAWAVGKTADEIAAGMGEDGKSSDADLSAGCTIIISAFVEAMDKAMANATACDAAATDTVQMAMVTNTGSSKDATADKDGTAQADVTVSAVTLNAEGVVTASALDVVQAKISFSAAGAVTADLATAPSTKQELGNDYNMKGASPIGKEWYEQADAFTAWTIGKTADQIAAGVGEDGKASDADLAAGCTITVSDLITAASTAATVG